MQCDSKSPEAAVLPPAGMCLFACSDPVFAQAKSKSNEVKQERSMPAERKLNRAYVYMSKTPANRSLHGSLEPTQVVHM